MSSRSHRAVALGLVLSAAALVTAPGAVARDGAGDRDGGTCSDGTSYYRMRVDPDGSRLTVSLTAFSDDTNVWEWRLRQNGDLIDKGQVRAKDGDRSFRIERTTIDFYGEDDFVLRAENQKTGEVCRGEVEI